uniref:Uncharacterized protein n=1 Tax=viral metagenome TaxID=1070528 RepID=A0A6C0DWF9_9ZZZZ
MENEEFLEKINSTEKKLGNNKFQEQIEELKKKLVDYDHKATQDKEINANLQKNINELNNTICQLHDNIKELETQIANNTDKETINNFEKQLDVKNSEITQLNQSIQHLNISINDITKSKTTIEDELQKHLTHYSEFQTNFNQFNETHQETINKLQEAQNSIKSLEDNLSVKNNEIEKLEEENNFLKNELNDYKSNYVTLQTQLEERFETFKQEFLSEHTIPQPTTNTQVKSQRTVNTQRGITRTRR